MTSTVHNRVLDRFLEPVSASLNEEAARKLIGLKADRKSQARVAKLARKCNDGTLTLEEMRQIAIARLNTLMHLAPDSALPPPPRQLRPAEALPDVQVLRDAALARRPDLAALADRIKAEQANLALAHKEFYPDLEVSAVRVETVLRDLRPAIEQLGRLPALP